MKLAPLDMRDPWASRIQRQESMDAGLYEDVSTELLVNMKSIEFMYHGPEMKYRPYLHLRGEIAELVPDEDQALPYGIESLPYRSGSMPQYSVFYEFTDEQLADLVDKGFYSKEFEPPQDMTELVWPLPGTVDYLVVYPESFEDVPVVFAQVQNRHDLVLTAENSGHDLDMYFQALPENELAASLEQTVQHDGPSASDQYQGLFAGQANAEYEGGQQTPVVAEPVSEQQTADQRDRVSDSVFDRLVAEVEEDYDQQAQAETEALAADPDSVAHIYASEIAPKIEAALSGGVPEDATDQLRDAMNSSRTVDDQTPIASRHDRKAEDKKTSQRHAARRRKSQGMFAAEHEASEHGDQHGPEF